MKNKIIIIMVFVIGFIAGAITINSMTNSARKTYKEILRERYVQDQNAKASEAIKENNKLNAMIHLTNVLNADPVGGKKLLDNSLDKDMDEELFSFLLLPYIDQAIDELIYPKPGTEPRIIGMSHGKLAAVLDDLGYIEEAKFHWAQASSLLEMPEDKVKKSFHKLIETNSTTIE